MWNVFEQGQRQAGREQWSDNKRWRKKEAEEVCSEVRRSSMNGVRSSPPSSFPRRPRSCPTPLPSKSPRRSRSPWRDKAWQARRATPQTRFWTRSQKQSDRCTLFILLTQHLNARFFSVYIRDLVVWGNTFSSFLSLFSCFLVYLLYVLKCSHTKRPNLQSIYRHFLNVKTINKLQDNSLQTFYQLPHVLSFTLLSIYLSSYLIRVLSSHPPHQHHRA